MENYTIEELKKYEAHWSKVCQESEDVDEIIEAMQKMTNCATMIFRKLQQEREKNEQV